MHNGAKLALIQILGAAPELVLSPPNAKTGTSKYKMRG